MTAQGITSAAPARGPRPARGLDAGTAGHPAQGLRGGFVARRAAWLARGGSAETWRAAVRALAPDGASPMAYYLAAGVLVDVAEGRQPTGAVPLPTGWRALPVDVQRALGLPEGATAWWLRSRKAAQPEASLRELTIAAARCEAEQDEPGRREYAALVEARRADRR